MHHVLMPPPNAEHHDLSERPANKRDFIHGNGAVGPLAVPHGGLRFGRPPRERIKLQQDWVAAVQLARPDAHHLDCRKQPSPLSRAVRSKHPHDLLPPAS